MYRRIIAFSVIFLFVFVMSGCIEKTDKFSKKKTTTVTVDSTQLKIDALQEKVAKLHQQVKKTKIHTEQVVVQYDSITVENQLLLVENQKLKSQLAQVRNEVIPAIRLQYEDLFDKQQLAYKKLEGQLKSKDSELSYIQGQYSTMQADQRCLEDDIYNLSQWTKKYQHDSQRGFIKVLFGAGKALVPKVPAPQLE